MQIFQKKYIPAWIIVSALAIFIVVVSIKHSNMVDEIKKNKAIILGRITDAKYAYQEGINMDYEIIVNGVVYKGFIQCPCSFCPYNTLFVGHSFPVAYSLKNPEHHEMLLQPADFERYDLSFPDSLKWINNLQ
jgi:hypothetical protein